MENYAPNVFFVAYYKKNKARQMLTGNDGFPKHFGGQICIDNTSS